MNSDGARERTGAVHHLRGCRIALARWRNEVKSKGAERVACAAVRIEQRDDRGERAADRELMRMCESGHNSESFAGPATRSSSSSSPKVAFMCAKALEGSSVCSFLTASTTSGAGRLSHMRRTAMCGCAS